MSKPIAQNSSANIVIGPIMDASGSAVIGAEIANAAIVVVKEASVSAARNAATSAASVGPALYRIVLNSTDTDTKGTLVVLVSVSGGLPFRYESEVWQSTTWNLFYGTDTVATSANVSVVVAGALSNYDVPTSSDVSAIVSAVVSDVVAAGITSAQVSAIVIQALGDYDVPSSADVSVLVSVGVNKALTNYDVASSADVSAVLSGVLASYNVASAGELLTSAQVSAIGAQVLSDYDAPTSADVSAITVAVVTNARVNIGRVNDVSVSGAGTTADPWRPA